MASFFPARRVHARVVPGLERDRSWGAPSSWGDFGEGAPTAVGDQAYLGLDYGEYDYPSDPYRPYAFEQQPPPSDFGSEFEFLDPSAFSEDDYSGNVDNYRGVDPRAVDKEARSILYRYMGDIYRDASDTLGEPSHGAGSELGGGIRLRIQGSFQMHPVAVQALISLPNSVPSFRVWIRRTTLNLSRAVQTVPSFSMSRGILNSSVRSVLPRTRSLSLTP